MSSTIRYNFIECLSQKKKLVYRGSEIWNTAKVFWDHHSLLIACTKYLKTYCALCRFFEWQMLSEHNCVKICMCCMNIFANPNFSKFHNIKYILRNNSKVFSPLYALFLASDVFLVHSSGNDRTGILSLLCWK